MDVLSRHRVTVTGDIDAPALIFAPGYGAYQDLWRHVAPSFAGDHRVVLFDFIGEDRAEPSAYPPERYEKLNGYVDDLRAILSELDVVGGTLVGHSVGAMIGLMAAVAEPERFDRLVLIGASPRYLDDGDYTGGFTSADIEQLLTTIESNYLGWAEATAPVAMANPERPELAAELLRSFTRTDPQVALRFAKATFLLDHRADLAAVRVPTLVLQCPADVMVPIGVGEYLHRHIPDSRFELLENATGHFPHLSAPASTIDAIGRFLRR